LKTSRSKTFRLGDASATLHLGDGIAWMNARKACSIHAIVTDPPYGLREYTAGEQKKLRRGRGGVWRIPPTLDGHRRSPLPRFTVLTDADLEKLEAMMTAFARAALRVLVPGGHVFVASNPLLSHVVYRPLVAGGFERRGEIIRLVQTLRGGDRPKNAHREFAGVTVLPRSGFEPWGLFRKPCEGRVEDNLRRWKTGGLRRPSDASPFVDVIRSAPTRAAERALSNHPSLKPQAFMRAVVRAALPLGEGLVLDPFAGGGSTLAAALAVGYRSIGVEIDPRYFRIAARAVPRLGRLEI
jgi:site-specific DNA-methyltransferase (adenine-specific)